MIKKPLFIIVLIISLLFSVSSAFAKMVSVVGDNVNLRSGPGTKYSVKWKYGSGFPLKVLQQQAASQLFQFALKKP